MFSTTNVKTFGEFFQDLSFLLLLTLTLAVVLIDDVSQSKCWAAVLLFQNVSASSLANCSTIGDGAAVHCHVLLFRRLAYQTWI